MCGYSRHMYLLAEDIEIDKETGQKLETDTLPPDLEEYVHEDNTRFHEEIEEWDAEQKRKALQKADDVVVVREVKAGELSLSLSLSLSFFPSSFLDSLIDPRPRPL